MRCEIFCKDPTKVMTVKHICLQTLRCEFKSLSMDDSKSISTYLDRVQAILNQIDINGEYISDAGVVQKVICSVSSDYDNVDSANEEAHNLLNY